MHAHQNQMLPMLMQHIKRQVMPFLDGVIQHRHNANAHYSKSLMLLNLAQMRLLILKVQTLENQFH